MAHPITRTTLILQRFAALALAAAGITVAVWLAMLAIRNPAELTTISPAQFAAQCLNVALLAVVFGALATGLGAASGRRAVVFAVTAVVGVLAYAAHTFAGQLGIDWAAYLSPFHYYLDGEPLRHGFQWANIGVLIALSAILIGAGTYRFNHRDLNA
jgi:ABC-2 type transport system permease protein